MNPDYGKFLKASESDRRDVILGTSQRLGTAPQNVEKDYWVCWTLDALFSGLANDAPRLLFKGGTSLSKGYGLIERFSEDIDITIFRDDLGETAGIEELAKLERRPNLAVSINAPDRNRREEIMPITKKYPLEELIDALRRYPAERGREITIEYVLLAGYNDAASDAVALAKLIHGLRAKVNAIPFNADPNLPPWMKRPADAAIDRFVDTLVRNGVAVTVRRSKGREIAAACGQLRGKTEAPRHRRAS